MNEIFQLIGRAGRVGQSWNQVLVSICVYGLGTLSMSSWMSVWHFCKNWLRRLRWSSTLGEKYGTWLARAGEAAGLWLMRRASRTKRKSHNS
jgi:hypothetical protein